MICLGLLKISRGVKVGGTGKTIMGELHFSNWLPLLLPLVLRNTGHIEAGGDVHLKFLGNRSGSCRLCTSLGDVVLVCVFQVVLRLINAIGVSENEVKEVFIWEFNIVHANWVQQLPRCEFHIHVWHIYLLFTALHNGNAMKICSFYCFNFKWS